MCEKEFDLINYFISECYYYSLPGWTSKQLSFGINPSNVMQICDQQQRGTKIFRTETL